MGLFSLIQQTVANIPWALREGRVPIVYFQQRTCYWNPSGYQGSDTVWEYYFEPLVAGYPASRIPSHIRDAIDQNPPCPWHPGYFADDRTFVSNHFGDHPELEGKALSIPYLVDDPGPVLRQESSAIMRTFIRPRQYLVEKANRFFEARMAGHYVIGAHVRGTDATSKQELRWHRKGSLRLPRYAKEIRRLLKKQPDARIFVATDAQSSLDYLKEAFGNRVIAYDSLRHEGGEAAGKGPTGWIMPAYFAHDRDRAARNGEEAIIEYLLLSRCRHLIHNGSSLSRTVLLQDPDMPHSNTHTVPGYRRLLARAAAHLKTQKERISMKG